MRFIALTGFMALLAIGSVACGDDEGPGSADAGSGLDAQAPDAERPRSLCPVFDGPSCESQQACVEQSEFNNGEFQTVTESCVFCREFSASVCTFGECELREDLEEAELLVPSGGATLTVNLGGIASETSIIAALALQAETAGGETLDCDAFRTGSQALLDNACVNRVEVRTKDTDGVSESHTLSFSRFGGDRDIVFVAYAFSQPEAASEPLGVYCTRARVPAEPEGGTFQVPSEPGFELMTDLR